MAHSLSCRTFLVLAFCVAMLPGLARAEDPLNILFIGNSFTLSGDVPTSVADLAEDGGWVRPNCVNAAASGVTLEYHRSNATTLAYIDQGGWDFVVLQEYSTRPTDNPAVTNSNPLKFKQDATWLYDRVKASSPNAVIVLYETWARHEYHSFYPTYFDDRTQMQDQLNHHYHDALENYIPTNSTAAVKDDLLLAPCGEVWHADYLGDNYMLFGGDLYHPNLTGAHVNSLTIYSVIYNRTVADLPGGTMEQEIYLRSLVDSIVGGYYTPPVGPHITYDRTDLGDGLYGWTFYIGNDDGLMLSYAATLSFYTDPGTTLVNVQINGQDVNDQPTAEFVEPFGFDIERDTYSLTPFVNANSIPGNSQLWGDAFTGYREGTDWWEMSVGTGAGSQYGDGTPVAYVVADGDVNWIGLIARNNELYSAEGVTEWAILGDFTGDGVVDQADYTYWADHFGEMCSEYFALGSYALPDHAINTPEYTTWADHFGDTASQTLGMTQSIVPAGPAEPVLVTGGAAEGDYNNDGKVDLTDYTAWADSFGQNVAAEAPALEAVQSQTPAVEEEPADAPAQTRRAKIQARRAAALEARKARLQARRQARLERLNNR